ncbi:ClpXP protease specificity-enhancing factor [Nitrosovibrio sp. Nv17]|jgi:stringent starvation protein B|uniref:ClpXP protease specificity-enhancing factor n=1 Tax=Nitrosovibrio sp. Nv17 TaxID=1855339 RepID=UPI000908E65D|nr:ClpXP protease specificity-enhancing factor [Nitrosovibrio sp. Nv17]SFW28727.1 stringent starvation protein B [Nitrosovibrio sp. Nv17]
MKTPSTKPYLIRAIHEWCSDSGHTPYLSVKVDARTRVPLEFVRNGEIVLNISPEATHRLTLGNDLIQFSARFNGVSHEISIPVDAVLGIFPKETSQGILFPVTEESETAQSGADAGNADGIQPSSSTVQTGGKPHLQVVK